MGGSRDPRDVIETHCSIPFDNGPCLQFLQSLCSYHLHHEVGANLDPILDATRLWLLLHNLKQLYLDFCGLGHVCFS